MMTMKNKKVTGIVLSGGLSRRMGKEKGLCLLNDKPLVEYAIDILQKECSSVMIGSNNVLYRKFGFPVIEDEIKGIGPIGGIYSCLNSSHTDDNFILSCDMPMVHEDLLRHILAQREHYDVVVPLYDGNPEPLCAFYRKDITPVLRSQISAGDYKIQELLKKLKTKYLDIGPHLNFYHNHLFANINAEADLVWMEDELKKKLL